MAPIVKLRLGNLFDGPTDLIVLPCSTNGTVTGFIAESLAHYSIPRPPANMKLGAVKFLPFEGGENIAQYVAYAASVKGMTSSADSIKSIGAALGDFTKKQAAVRSVAAPLLGAGAGGLPPGEVLGALKAGFSATADSSASLIIHVLHKYIFDDLKGNQQVGAEARRDPIRVFISHTSASDENWVLDLALFLIERGIQARVDKLHLRHGMDLPQWMCNELKLANKVIIVCDEAYKLKADGRAGGVGWETMIIQGDIATLPADSTKYQVVVRSENLKAGLPMYLSTKYAFHAPPSSENKSLKPQVLTALLDLPLDERSNIKEFVIGA